MQSTEQLTTIIRSLLPQVMMGNFFIIMLLHCLIFTILQLI